MLNSQGFNLYTCVNPIKPDHVNNSVDDTDIACRRRLLIDIDRRGTLVAPATDHEIEHAERLADRIAARLLDECDAAVFRVMSGNGVHLYLPLQDLPNDSQSKDDCRGLLKGLADEFDNEIVKVDTIVYNASRITKLPGTIMRKGLESPDRPYRMARVV